LGPGTRAHARAAVLLFSALQVLLHAVDHVADADIARVGRVGVFDAVSLAVLGAAMLSLWRITTTLEETRA
jgi:hypothetical protein